MTNEHRPKIIPPLLLEKLALNHLSASEQKYLNTHWSESEQSAALNKLHNSNREILATLPVEVITPNIELRLKERAQVRPLRGRSRYALAAVAASLVLFFTWKNRQSEYSEGDILLKGSVPHITVYRKLASGYEHLKTGVVAHRGETMQLRYFAAGYPYGTILSIDGSGKVTQHLPAEAKDSEALKQQGEVALPFAYELDDAPMFERFVFVVSHKPFSIQPLSASLHSLYLQGNTETGALQLPPDSIQYSFVIRKK